MTIPIRPTGPGVSPVERGAGIPLGPAPSGQSFKDMLADAIGDVSRLQDSSKNAIDMFLRGEPIELHEVMAASEEASISLELLVEMRNKLADAYRTVMNMQA